MSPNPPDESARPPGNRPMPPVPPQRPAPTPPARSQSWPQQPPPQQPQRPQPYQGNPNQPPSQQPRPPQQPPRPPQQQPRPQQSPPPRPYQGNPNQPPPQQPPRPPQQQPWPPQQQPRQQQPQPPRPYQGNPNQPPPQPPRPQVGGPQQPWPQQPPRQGGPPPPGQYPQPVPQSDDGGQKSPQTIAADRKLLIGGSACIAVSLLSLALRLAGVLPSGLATLVVLLVAVIGLRIFIGYAARSASSKHRTRITQLITYIGLAVSVVTVFGALPTLLKGGGSGHFTSNVIAHLWTLAILLVVVGSARTFNWLALIGMGLTAFLAVTGLAYTVGQPVVKAMGSTSTFATSVYVPITEEVLKALPALLILIFAARRRNARPSAVEMALLGAVLGTGFALYEDAQFRRGGFDFGAMPIISILNPTAHNDSALRIAYVNSGHMILTALIVFGLGIGLLYRRRFWWAKFAIPVTLAVSIAEHCTQNYAVVVASGQGNDGVFNLLRVLTLWGWLSSLLLIGGVAWVARAERRVTSNGLSLKETVPSSFWLRPLNAQRAAVALARTQLSPVPAGQGASS